MCDSLAAIPGFTPCRRETLDRLWQAGQLLRLRGKRFLFHQGAALDNIYLHLSGKSFLYTVTPMGHRRVFDLCGPGTLVNPFTLLTEVEETALCHCETLSPSQLLAVPRETFLQAMGRDWELTCLVLRSQQRSIRHMEHQIRNAVSSLPCSFRMAALFSDLAEEYGIYTAEGVILDLEANVSMLGDLLGVPRETASRARKVLMEQGVLHMEGKRMILHPRRLSEYLHPGIEQH